ncbi:hypothetical protein NFI96_032620 [Prochilodus magdalenae]|nr:hypothetical protein NFI96_032620 [Prochilodus magdalenae]
MQTEDPSLRNALQYQHWPPVRAVSELMVPNREGRGKAVLEPCELMAAVSDNGRRTSATREGWMMTGWMRSMGMAPEATQDLQPGPALCSTARPFSGCPSSGV